MKFIFKIPHKKWLIRLIGIFILIFILSRMNIALIYFYIKKANIKWWMLSIFIGFFCFVFRAIRWQYILFKLKSSVKLKRLIQIVIIGATFGRITPAYIGELIVIPYLKREGCDTWCALNSLIIDRLFGILGRIFFVIIGIFSLYVFFKVQILNIWSIIALGIIFFIVGAWVLFGGKLKCINKFLNFLVKLLIPTSYRKKVKQGTKKLFVDMSKFKKDFGIVALTIFIFVLGALRLYILFFALDLKVSVFFVVSLASVILLVQMLPNTVLNIGNREAVCILFFNMISLSSEEGVAFSFLILSQTLLYSLMGLLLWFKVKNPYLSDTDTIKKTDKFSLSI
jgi:uncharacterized protein (TIRG00374 family)